MQILVNIHEIRHDNINVHPPGERGDSGTGAASRGGREGGRGGEPGDLGRREAASQHRDTAAPRPKYVQRELQLTTVHSIY